MLKHGKRIVFEGGEYTGKSTQTALQSERLGARSVREPGGTAIGTAIRSILLDPANDELEAMTEVMLFAADRAQLMATIVGPTLESGQHVISDRSWISSAAYQSARGIKLDDILTVNKIASGRFFIPDLLIIFDASPDAVAARRQAERDHFESMNDEFHQAVRSNLLELGKEMGGIVIDATQELSVVTGQVQDIIDSYLDKN